MDAGRLAADVAKKSTIIAKAPVMNESQTCRQRGVLVDAGRLAALSADFANRTAALEREVFALAGREFAIASPKQLAQVRARARAFVCLGLYLCLYLCLCVCVSACARDFAIRRTHTHARARVRARAHTNMHQHSGNDGQIGAHVRAVLIRNCSSLDGL